MKLTVLLLMVAMFQVNATGLAQTVTISSKDITLKQVFAAIKKQTGYVVFSNTNTINQVKNLAVEVESMALRDLLDIVLTDLPVTYLIKEKTIVLSHKEPEAQSIKPVAAPTAAFKVSGVIKSASGEALEGASIRVKHSTRGTVSDARGVFSLENVAENAVLQISMLGYKTIEVGLRKTEKSYTAFTLDKKQAAALKVSGTDQVQLLFTMEANQDEMGDVVVTGYLNVDKRNYVGAVFSTKADSILVAGETSIDQMLQGMVPGMLVTVGSGQVGATPKIRVRGTSTILGNQEPLWVVDGVIQRDPLPIPQGSGSLAGDASELRLIASNAISWLNPNDIDNITILKDASATAIYGSQAANGVIVLTTKKARPGQLGVSYSGSFNIGQKPSYANYDLMNSQELMQFSKEVYESRNSYTSEILPIGYGGLIQKLQRKEINQAQLEEAYRKMELQNTDWFDILFRNSMSSSHNISMSGGTEKIVNRTSFSYQDQKGEARGNDLYTLSASSNTSLRFGNRLTVGLLLNGSMREANGFAYEVSPFDYAYNTSRTIPLYNEDGSLLYHEKKGDVSTAIPSQASYLYNIQNELDNTGNTNATTKLTSTIDVNLKLHTNLQYQALVSYTTAKAEIKSYATEFSHFITQTRGYEAGSVLSNSAEELSSRLPFGGLVAMENAASKSTTVKNSLVYTNRFNNLHTITTQLGVETRSEIMQGSMDTRYGYLRYRGESYAPVPQNPTLLIPGAALNLHEEMRLNSNIINRQTNYLSEYFSALYGFDQRFVFNLNVRMDASNRFGQDKNKRFQPTWSLGAKWNLANERVFDNVTWLNAFDVSASYGYQGNAVESVSPFLIATDGGLSYIYNQYVLNIKSLPYPELGWEKTKTWNLGLDLSFFDNRVNASLNWYKKFGNILASREVPVENGMNSAIVFGSEMENYGYDMLVNVVPIKTSNFIWQFSVNAAFSGNRLKNNERINTLSDYLDGSAIVNGEAYSTFYSYIYNGLNGVNGRPTFKNMDIKPTDNPLEYLVKSGKLEPDFAGGFNTLVKYQNISLRAQFAMAFGAQKRLPRVYNQTGAPTPEQNAPKYLKNRWRSPGDEAYTNIPSIPEGNLNKLYIQLPSLNYLTDSPYNLYNLSDFRIADMDFIRCRQVGISYDFLPATLQQLKLKRLAVSLSLTNPFMIAFDKSWNGYDPETGGWPARKTTSISINMGL